MFFSQEPYRVRCEWGEEGIAALAPISDVIIIVDVLSFSTCVEIAVGRDAVLWPWRWKDETAAAVAAMIGGELAGKRGEGTYSLSPASLRDIPPGTDLVLPSPNGSTLTLAAAEQGKTVLTGSFRNATAIARAARTLGGTIALIPAGERWPDGTLRPALEDWLGAGAVIAALGLESASPEAISAAVAFQEMRKNLLDHLPGCSSGRELIERGFEEDVRLAAEHDVSSCVPIVHDVRLKGPGERGEDAERVPEVRYCYRRWKLKA